METIGNKILLNSASKFYCVFCDYGTSKKSSYDDHLLSAKHKKQANGNKEETKFCQILLKQHIKDVSHTCETCHKEFKTRTGLWKHNQKCSVKLEQLKNDLVNEEKQQELIQYLLKENSEFKQLMLEQNKHMLSLAEKVGNTTNSSHNTTNSNNTTNNNQNFNLQLYLNETCKNAMNIMDFVSQLNVGIKDLEETGRLGFAEGISKIFINGLKQINVNDRPIHCSDMKRETLYIRSNDEWNKEGEEKTLLTNALKHVAHKNMKQIFEWTKTHPDYNDPDSRENDKYLQIVSESMPGSTKEETNKNYNKIIKNIVKETVIDK